jgi:very-short-patch-repair endonuclease
MARRIHATDINPAALAAAGVEPEKPISKAKIIAAKLEEQIEQRGLGPYEREYAFANTIGRRWRFDFAWPQHKLALEIEGLIVMRIGGELVCKGRHASITGFKDDCEKYAWAAIFGWRVMRFEQSQVKDKTAIDMLVRAIASSPRYEYKAPVADQAALIDTPQFAKSTAAPF